LPITITLIDWSLNAIVYDKQHILTQLPVFFIYGMVNLTIVKITGFVIYPGVTWDSWLSWLLALSALPASILLWYFLAWCTNKKTLRLLKNNIENVPEDLRNEIEPGYFVEYDDRLRNDSIDGDKLIQQ